MAVEDKPTLRLDDDMFMALVDAIHNNGYKPREGKYTEGKLEATEKHLDDMRKIVFEDMKLKNKKIFISKDSLLK